MTLLKEYRIDSDMVQKEMADKLGCSLPAYRNYENGKRELPLEILRKFLLMRARPEDIELATIIEEIKEK